MTLSPRTLLSTTAALVLATSTLSAQSASIRRGEMQDGWISSSNPVITQAECRYGRNIGCGSRYASFYYDGRAGEELNVKVVSSDFSAVIYLDRGERAPFSNEYVWVTEAAGQPNSENQFWYITLKTTTLYRLRIAPERAGQTGRFSIQLPTDRYDVVADKAPNSRIEGVVVGGGFAFNTIKVDGASKGDFADGLYWRLGLGMEHLVMFLENESGTAGEAPNGLYSVAQTEYGARWYFRSKYDYLRPFVLATYGDHTRDTPGGYPEYKGNSFTGGGGFQLFIIPLISIEAGATYGQTTYKQSRLYAENYKTLSTPLKATRTRFFIGLASHIYID